MRVLFSCFLVPLLVAAASLAAAEEADGPSPLRLLLSQLAGLDRPAATPQATPTEAEREERLRQRRELERQLRQLLEEEAAAGGDTLRQEMIQLLPEMSPLPLEGAAYVLRALPDERALEPLKARALAAGAQASEGVVGAILACCVSPESQVAGPQFLIDQFLAGTLASPAVLKVLGRSGNQMAVTLLAQVLRGQETSEEMRRAAIVGVRLFSLRYRRGTPPDRVIYIDPLLDLYDELENRVFREELIRLAGRIGGEGAVEFLDRVGSASGGRVRLVAVEQLTQISGREAAIVLNGWMRDDHDYRFRRRILESYRQMNLIWTAPGLIVLLGDEHDDLRLGAHRLLMELSGRQHEIDDIERWMMWWAAWFRQWEEEQEAAMPGGPVQPE